MPTKIVTKNEIIKDIIATAKKIKAVPTRAQYRQFGKFASSTLERRLGSYSVSENLKATNFSWSN